MSQQFILRAIRDVAPTLEEPYPRQIIDYSNSLYALSKVKGSLDPQFEVARCHLCCYLTIEKFASRLDLPEPVSDKIPIPSRKVRSILVQFHNSLLNRTVQTETPPSTPRKRRQRVMESGSPTPSPRKRQQRNPYLTPESTPAKKRTNIIDLDKQQQKEEEETPETPLRTKGLSVREKLSLAAKDEAAESAMSPTPSSPSTRASTPGLGTPSRTPKKRNMHRPTISTALLVSFCNRFFIPEETTRNILKTFGSFHMRVKSPWGLLCGLVAVAFTNLNRTFIENRIGYKSKMMQNLQVLQGGGLKMEEIGEWIKVVERLCSEEPWIKEMVRTHNLDVVPRGIPALSAYISGNVCYHSPEMERSYNDWVDTLREEYT